jgi:hypothetical protein
LAEAGLLEKLLLMWQTQAGSADWEEWVRTQTQHLEQQRRIAGLEGLGWVQERLQEQVGWSEEQGEQHLWNAVYAAKEKSHLQVARFIAESSGPALHFTRASADASGVKVIQRSLAVKGHTPLSASAADCVGLEHRGRAVAHGALGTAAAAATSPPVGTAPAAAQGMEDDVAAEGENLDALVDARQLLEALVGELRVVKRRRPTAAVRSLLSWLQAGGTNTLAADSKRVLPTVFGMQNNYACNFLKTASSLLQDGRLAAREVVELFALELVTAVGDENSS